MTVHKITDGPVISDARAEVGNDGQLTFSFLWKTARGTVMVATYLNQDQVDDTLKTAQAILATLQNRPIVDAVLVGSLNYQMIAALTVVAHQEAAAQAAE